MGPFFQVILAESWGCPGMLRMPSGFKAWRLFAHGLQTLSRLLNARALSGSNPQLTFSIPKRAPYGALFQIRTGGELGMSGHATHALRLQSLAAFRPRATNAFAFA